MASISRSSKPIIDEYGIGSLTESQKATIYDAIKNYYWASRVEVYVRASNGIAVIHLYDEDKSVFYAKIERDGKYS